jgi:hypothetical protein
MIERPPPGGLSISGEIRAYMMLAVEAFTQDQKGHSMDVKIVAASRASAGSRKKCGNDQNEYPDNEYASHCFSGGRYLIGDH